MHRATRSSSRAARVRVLVAADEHDVAVLETRHRTVRLKVATRNREVREPEEPAHGNA